MFLMHFNILGTFYGKLFRQKNLIDYSFILNIFDKEKLILLIEHYLLDFY